MAPLNRLEPSYHPYHSDDDDFHEKEYENDPSYDEEEHDSPRHDRHQNDDHYSSTQNSNNTCVETLVDYYDSAFHSSSDHLIPVKIRDANDSNGSLATRSITSK
jgi:hypothetical protein